MLSLSKGVSATFAALVFFVGTSHAQVDPSALDMLWLDNDPPLSKIASSLDSTNRFNALFIPKLLIRLYVAEKTDQSTVYSNFCLDEINYNVGGSTRSCATTVTIKFANDELLSFDTTFKQGELKAVNELRNILSENGLVDGGSWTVAKLGEALQTAGDMVITISGDIFPDVEFTIAILPDAATTVALSNTPSGTLAAGTNSVFTAKVQDQYGNTATNAADSTLTLVPDSEDEFTVALSKGEGTTKFTRRSPQTVVITATHPSISTITPASTTLTFIAGPTKQVIATTEVTEVPEGETIEITLTAYDAFKNVNTAESREINLVSGGTVYGLVTLVNGIGKQTVTSAAQILVIGQQPKSVFGADTKFNPVSGLTLTFTAVCDGITGYQDDEHQVVCKDVTDACTPGTFEKVAPTSTNNRECVACDGVTEYQDQADQSTCLAMSEDCQLGSRVSVAPSASNDIECELCDGVLTYSDSINSPSCTNISVCVAGEEEIAAPTTSSDRGCSKCALGFFDNDSSGATVCEPCNQRLEAFVNVTGEFGTSLITFSQSFNQSTDISMVHLGQPGVASVQVLTQSCRSNRTLYPPFATLVHNSQSSDVDLVGDVSVFGRGVLITYGAGQTACADVDTWLSALPTYTDERGLTQCSNVSTCKTGQRTLAMATHISDQTCTPCNGVIEYQDIADTRFCAVIDTCSAGLKPVVFPDAVTNRVCGDVTCPGLSAPAYGVITNCNGTDKVEPYKQQCTYSCPATGFIPVDVTRTCQQSGVFDGAAPTCECDGTLNLDTINGICVKFCPTGFIQRAGEKLCTACSDTCTEGQFESQACAPSVNNDRECATCTECGAGTWAIGGCFSNNATDTVCVPFTDCEPGFYETVAGTSVTDRECSKCRACDSSLGLFQASGCCGTSDSVCDSLTECPLDTYELKSPLNAPQGGYNTDRVCKDRTPCGSGEYRVTSGNATTDNVCSACSDCEFGTYKTANCTETTDTECTPWTTCNASFVNVGGSPHSDVDCVECSQCDSSIEYQVEECTPTNDTVCAPLTVCNPVDDWEMVPNSLTSDRVCAQCSNCSEGVTTLACSATADAECGNTTETADCPRGMVQYGIAPFTLCVNCVPCDPGTYAEGGLDCRGDPSKGAFSTVCTDWSECPVGFIETISPSSANDRGCSRCASCPLGTHPTNASLCTVSVDDLTCEPDDECPEGYYESSPSTVVSPRECWVCTECEAGEYVSRECSGTEDTICSTVSSCAWDEQVLLTATSTTDTVCLGCDGVVFARPNVDPNLCPVPYSLEKCDTSTPAPTPNEEVFTQVRFVLEADYATTVTADPLYTHRVVFFQDSLTEYLTINAPIGNATIKNLKAVEGSIVVTLGLFFLPTTNASSRVSIGSEMEGWLKSDQFQFEFAGSVLTLDPTTVEQSNFNPLSTVAPSPSPTRNPTVFVQTTTVTTTTTTTPTNATAPTVNTTEPVETATADADESLGGGAIAGIVIGVLIALVVVAVVVVVLVKRKSREDNKFNKGIAVNSVDNDDYITMGPDATLARGGGGGDLTDENKKLQQEVDAMGGKIAHKNAIISEQHKAQNLAQQTLEVAIAAKLKKENDILQSEIQAMKTDLKKKRQASQFQKAAALQAQLKAEKLALQEEIVRSDQVAQIALAALDEYDTLQSGLEEEEQQARVAEMSRIQQEKERLSAEMAQLAARLGSLD
eukprot:m.173093 g.173093  ORF g.173093 m.173093 type:complete len:1696 (+) comp31717_c2_seq1:210-5297(+)